MWFLGKTGRGNEFFGKAEDFFSRAEEKIGKAEEFFSLFFLPPCLFFLSPGKAEDFFSKAKQKFAYASTSTARFSSCDLRAAAQIC